MLVHAADCKTIQCPPTARISVPTSKSWPKRRAIQQAKLGRKGAKSSVNRRAVFRQPRDRFGSQLDVLGHPLVDRVGTGRWTSFRPPPVSLPNRWAALQPNAYGMYNSALAREAPMYPPATSTFPLGSNIPVWEKRALFSEPVAVHVPVTVLYSSALAREPLVPSPPATSTFPLGSRV